MAGRTRTYVLPVPATNRARALVFTTTILTPDTAAISESAIRGMAVLSDLMISTLAWEQEALETAVVTPLTGPMDPFSDGLDGDRGGRRRGRRRVKRVSSPERESGALYRTVWGVLLGIGLVAALVQAVMLGPADRKNAFTDPSTALAIAVVAGVIAIPTLLIVWVLRVPDQKSARTGETVAVLVGMICGGILVFRLVVGGSDDRGFDQEDLAAWLPMTAVSVLLIIGIAVRSDLVRRRLGEPARAG